MLTEDRYRQHAQPPGRHRQSTGQWATTLLAVALAVGAVVCAGVVVVSNIQKKGTPSGSGQTAVAVQSPQANRLPASEVNAPKSWKLTFDSDFTGSTLNTKKYATCYYWAINSATGCTNYGSSNAEKEWYLPSQVKVSNGTLHLTAQLKRTAGLNAKGKPEDFACRSGMVTTLPSYSFKYGDAQMVARLPSGNGLWSAFWLAAANKKWPPEIDIFEHWSAEPEAKVYLHPLGGPRQGGPVAAVSDLFKGWHTFTLHWTKNSLTWYIDNYEVFTTNTDVPQQAMYIVANLADIATTPGSCSGTMLVKSIKVWQP